MANNPPSTLSIMKSPEESLAESSGLGIKKELIRFYSLFALTVFFVYYTPPIFNKAYFILLLALFWKSKRDYFWFAFVLILINQAGGLFRGALATDVYRVPMYNVAAGISFTFYDLFFITAFAKALKKGKRTSLILKNPLMILLFYLVFLILISLVLGMSKDRIVACARGLTTYTLFISIPFLIYKKEDLFTFIHLVFPIVFLSFAGQIYFLLSSESLESFFVGSNVVLMAPAYSEAGRIQDFIRPSSVFNAVPIYFSYIYALFFIAKKDYTGSRPYLYIIVSICLLGTVMSATRSWIIMYAVVFLLYCVYVSRSMFRLLPLLVGMCLVCFSAYFLVPGVNYAVNNSLRRTHTIVAIAKGDMTAGGTLSRIDTRLPKALEGIKKSPLIGWGFSNTIHKYSQGGHVGNFDMVLQVGIIGFLLFLNFWLSFFKMIYSTRGRLSSSNSYKIPLLVFAIALFGLLLLHFTSYGLFAYSTYQLMIFSLIYFFWFSDFMVREARDEESLIKSQTTT